MMQRTLVSAAACFNVWASCYSYLIYQADLRVIEATESLFSNTIHWYILLPMSSKNIDVID